MTPKRKIWILLVATLAAVLMGCESGKVVLDEPTENLGIISHTMPSETMQESANKDWVIAAITKDYNWDDSVGNRNEVRIRLPHLNSDLPFAVEFNNHIESYATEITKEIDECVAGAFSTHIISIDYETWQNNDILSILITTNTATDYVEYQVWNFDLDDGETLSTAEMCDKYLDLEYPQFLKYTRDMILLEFQTDFADFIKSYPAEYEFMQNLYLSDRLIVLHYELFLNEEGKLMLVADRPSIAGAMSYSAVKEFVIDANLVSNEADAWNWLFDLYLSSDPDNEEYAAQLLRIAYEENNDAFTDAMQQRTSSEISAIQTALRANKTEDG